MESREKLIQGQGEIDNNPSVLNTKREKSSKKEDKVYLTASFDGLCDIVLNEGRVKFLLDTGEIRENIIIDGKLFIPPQQEDLDYLLPNASVVIEESSRHKITDKRDDKDIEQGCPYCLELLKELIDYHKAISELPNNLYYYLLALWDYHTYLIDKFIFSPILYFFADRERGKTRTAKGLIYVARRGIMTETLREANLIRWGRDHKATLLFDVKNFAKKLLVSGAEDLVYGRVERGVVASRVLFPEKGAFKDTVKFEVFGPTVVTSNRMIDDIGLSRTITIDMKPSDKIFLTEPTKEEGLTLREKLTGMRLAHLKQTFIEVKKQETGRIEDMLIGYLGMIKTLFPKMEERYVELKKLIKEQKQEVALDSFEAQILQIIINCEPMVEAGSVVLIYDQICSIYNGGKRENLHLDGRSMGRITKGMGFTSKKNSDRTKRGIFYDTQIIKKLKQVYGIEDEEDTGGHPPKSSMSSPASKNEEMPF